MTPARARAGLQPSRAGYRAHSWTVFQVFAVVRSNRAPPLVRSPPTFMMYGLQNCADNAVVKRGQVKVECGSISHRSRTAAFLRPYAQIGKKPGQSARKLYPTRRPEGRCTCHCTEPL